MRFHIHLLSFLLLLASHSSVQGQSISQRHYGVKDGLPSSTVYTVAQDIDGFIWFGTEAGLTRFDGAEFKTYTTKDGLPDNEIISLAADSVGRLWITAYKRGISYLYKGKFHTLDNDPLLKSLPSSSNEDLTIVIAGRKDRCWIYSRQLCRVSGNKVHIFPEIKPAHRLRWVEEISDSEFIVYTHQFVFRYKNDALVSTFNLTKLMPTSDLASFGRLGKYFVFALDSSIRLLENVGDADYAIAHTIKVDGKAFNQNPTQSTNPVVVGSKLFISALNLGTYIFDLPITDAPKPSFIANHSTSLFKDRDDNVWIATSDNGIYLYHLRNFLTVDHNAGLVNENIGCIYADSPSKVWFGDGKGSIQLIDNGVLASSPQENRNQPFRRSRKIIHDGNLIYFINDDGCWIYDVAKRNYFKLPTSSSTKSMILSKKRDKIFVGTALHILFVDKTPPFRQEIHVVDRRITALCEDTSGVLYCGSTDGLYRWNDTLAFIGGQNELLKSRITSMALSTKHNIIWIGTSSSGVIGYKDGKVLCNINYSNNKNSISGAICRSVFVDEKDQLWVATNNGLNRIIYTTTANGIEVQSIVPFFAADGLADDDVNDIFAKDTMAYVATSKGVSIFNYLKVATAKAPPVYITSVAIDQASTSVKAKYILPFPQNNVTIGFTGLSFASNGKLTYRYQLKGVDETWTYTEARQVELKSLHDGNYTFVVEALDKFGNASLQPARIDIQVLPAFYMRWWFWIATASFFAFTIYAITRWWYSRQRKSENSLKELNEKIYRLEQKALRAQMNPHFIFNSLTAIQYFINSEDAESANKYLGSFAKLIRKTLDNSSENIITVDKEMQYLENYIQLEQMRFNNEFAYSISSSKDVLKLRMHVPVMLTQPYVENAIRHGLRNKETNDAFLSVKYYMEDNFLICEIDDNGIGRHKSALLKTDYHIEYQSKGMKISSDRIEAINNIKGQKIKVEIIDKLTTEGASQGTRVILYFQQNFLT